MSQDDNHDNREAREEMEAERRMEWMAEFRRLQRKRLDEEDEQC